MKHRSGARSGPRIRRPAETAAGAPAVVETLRHILGKAGIYRGTAALLKVNQPNGFDCPGCAWPEPLEGRKHAEFCENGAKAVADEATRARIGTEFFEKWTIRSLAQQPGQWLNAQGRLTHPMVRRPGADHYSPISWAEALDLIASELNGLESPDQAAFYTSGRTSNEAAFLYQLFVRRYGTNNLPDCSNMCHESSGRALHVAIGSGKGTVSLEDFDRADAIFIIGQNPGSNHPRMLATLQQAKRRGARIVSINPLDETGLKRFRNPQEVAGYVGRGTVLADLHLPVRINGDVALLKGLCKAMLEEEAANPGSVLDSEFIESSTADFAEFSADIDGTTWSEITAAAGVDRGQIQAAADIAIAAEATICCWAMGLTQHKNAVANIQEIVNFLLLKGNFGKPGAGACPVRGHSNVQGDRTMGIWERPDKRFLGSLQQEFGFEPPTRHGLDTVDTIRAMADGRVKVFIALGGNFLAATPDTAFTARGLENCRLTVQISTKLNQSHTVVGRTALILPTLGRTEIDPQPGGPQFVTVENSMGVVAPSEGRLAQASPFLRSEVRIVADMAQATLPLDPAIDWSVLADDYSRIREHIARVIPGFESFEQRLQEDGRLVLSHVIRDQRRFETPSGRAHFSVHPIEPPDLPESRFLMMTIRSHDQFNTTVYTQNDRYRGVFGDRRVVFMNQDDILRIGLKDGEVVDLHSHFNGEQRTVNSFRIVEYRIPLGCVATYYPETNEIIPLDHVADISNTPAYKSVVVSVSQSVIPEHEQQ